MARRGAVGFGEARQGKARAVYSGLPIGNSGFSGGNTNTSVHGMACRGGARLGRARHGKGWQQRTGDFHKSLFQCGHTVLNTNC